MKTIEFEFLFGKVYVTSAMTRVTVSYVTDTHTFIVDNSSVDVIEFSNDVNMLEGQELDDAINEALEIHACKLLHNKIVTNCLPVH